VTERVLVIGGSGQGRQAIDVLEATGRHEVVGVLDKGLPAGAEVSGYPVLGRDDELAASAKKVGATAFLVGIGDNPTRRVVYERSIAECPFLRPITAIHPAAIVSHRASIGPGSLVMAGVVVSNDCFAGTGVLLGTKSSVDHDCLLGDFVSLAPAATTGGGVRIGDDSALGLGAQVIHGVTVGAQTVVGDGSLVLRDVPDRVVAYGVPARVVRTRAPSEPYLDTSSR